MRRKSNKTEKSDQSQTDLSVEVPEKKVDKPTFKPSTSKSKRPSKFKPTAGASGNSKKPTAPKKPQDVIPSGMGISVPNFRRFNDSDEETNIPLGIAFGHYTPQGQDAATEFYPQLCSYYLQGIRSKLKEAGYAQEFTNDDIRDYLEQVSTILQMYKFVYDLRSISKLLHVHTSPVLSTVTSQAINGRLVANHRNSKALIANLPYPKGWKDIYWNSLGVTTMSDNPNSGIRLFAPKSAQSAEGRPLEANNLVDALSGAINIFYANDTSVLLSTVLQKVLPLIGDLSEYTDVPFSYNGDVVNNLLNLGYWDSTGPIYSPFYGDTDTVPLFYRRNLKATGCLTFVPDNNVLASPQASVWSQAYALETEWARHAYDNVGRSVPVVTDSNLWLNFGSVWEADVTLNAGRSPSITRVNATFEGVATGLAGIFFGITM
jgi:hypothetical protein